MHGVRRLHPEALAVGAGRGVLAPPQGGCRSWRPRQRPGQAQGTHGRFGRSASTGPEKPTRCSMFSSRMKTTCAEVQRDEPVQRSRTRTSRRRAGRRGEASRRPSSEPQRDRLAARRTRPPRAADRRRAPLSGLPRRLHQLRQHASGGRRVQERDLAVADTAPRAARRSAAGRARGTARAPRPRRRSDRPCGACRGRAWPGTCPTGVSSPSGDSSSTWESPTPSRTASTPCSSTVSRCWTGIPRPSE